jgi:putative peptidoglycan lipid II flippase
MSLARALLNTSSLTLLSRITGLIRDILIAKTFGASGLRDAFEIAFQLPNMMRRLFAEGAFSQAFVPFLGRTQASEGDAAAKALINKIATAQLLALLAFTALGILLAPWIVLLFASGFAQTPGKVELTTQLLRIMFPYLLFISFVALAGGILNTWKRFAIPAFTPVLLNLSMIAGAIVLAPNFSQPIMGLAWGVFIGGVVQMALQIRPLVALGTLPSPDFALNDPAVKKVLAAMGPALLGVSVAQVSMFINTNYASYFGEGSVSWLKTADRLMEFPTALLGVALGTVLLPSLSRAAAKSNDAEMRSLLSWGIRIAVLLSLPAAVVMVILAEPIVATLFQRGAFTVRDVAQTQWAVVAYAVGVLGLVLVKIFAPAFYAQADIRTPVRISIIVLIATQIVNALLVFFVVPTAQRHAALALGTSVGALLNAALLWRGLRARGLGTVGADVRGFVLRVLVAAALLGAVCWVGRMQFGPWTNVPELTRITKLATVLACAGGTYLLALFALGFRPSQFRR